MKTVRELWERAAKLIRTQHGIELRTTGEIYNAARGALCQSEIAAGAATHDSLLIGALTKSKNKSPLEHAQHLREARPCIKSDTPMGFCRSTSKVIPALAAFGSLGPPIPACGVFSRRGERGAIGTLEFRRERPAVLILGF